MGGGLVTAQNMTREKCCKYELNGNLHGIKEGIHFLKKNNLSKTLTYHTLYVSQDCVHAWHWDKTGCQ